jgi:Zn-dependent metalloprotease
MNVMQTIPQHCCFVIPPHILRNIAGSGAAAASELHDGAQETIETMEALVQEREQIEVVSARVRLNRRIHVYDAGHLQKLPGKVALTEKDKRRGDLHVVEAFSGCEYMYDFLFNVLSRNSIDGRGLRMDATVHYGRRFDNAFWNGRQIIIGDGDGKLFRRFTVAIEVLGHEWAHALTQSTAALGYRGQTGALNEHLSDAFGMMLKQWVDDLLPRQSNWVIGDGLFTSAVNGKGVRSMAAPGTAYDDPILGKDPQPSHMDDYVETDDDNGGIHINSGILNRAFYLAAMALKKRSWETLGPVWYETLRRRLQPDAGFEDFAAATVDQAGETYGVQSDEQRAIADAWEAVGLPVPLIASPQLKQAGGAA